mmetsp:Transcript_10758/g.11874  ORF Transcript_10758/g.11874 Transcript_10758/m.11874 type:complete len:151 (+) Transcript_10758:560-1012(+)
MGTIVPQTNRQQTNYLSRLVTSPPQFFCRLCGRFFQSTTLVRCGSLPPPLLWNKQAPPPQPPQTERIVEPWKVQWREPSTKQFCWIYGLMSDPIDLIGPHCLSVDVVWVSHLHSHWHGMAQHQGSEQERDRSFMEDGNPIRVLMVYVGRW